MILSQHVETGTATRLLAESPERLGYLLKDRVGDVEEFAGTLRRVAAGGSALDPEVVSRLLATHATSCVRCHRASGEVLRSSPRAARTEAIGDQLAVSERAVQKHVTAIFAQARAAGRRGRQPAHPRRPGATCSPSSHAPRADRPAAGFSSRTPGTPGGPISARAPGWDLRQVPRLRSTTMQTARRPERTSHHDRRPPSSPRATSSAATAPATPPSTPCAASRSTSPRPPDRRDGPVGLRQVDAHAHPRRPRQAHRRARSPSPASTSAASTTRS